MRDADALREAHESGLWDELVKLVAPLPMIGAADTAGFVDRLILERAKRRADLLVVDSRRADKPNYKAAELAIDRWYNHNRPVSDHMYASRLELARKIADAAFEPKE